MITTHPANATASTSTSLPADGERCLPVLDGPWAFEHLHRYSLASQVCRGRDVLDVASGEGYGSNLLADAAASVVGVDLSGEAVAHAAASYRRGNLSFREGSATSIPLDDAAVDVVVSFETLEHLDAHDEMLAEIKRVLRPGGLMVMSTPDKDHYPDERINDPDHPFTNEFHVRELTTAEFKALVGRHFARARYLRQRVVHASLLVPDEGPTPGFEAYCGGFEAVRRAEPVAEPVYVLALASDGEVPEVAASMYEAWELVSGLQRHIRRLKTSPSHRLGRALTWPVRRLLRGR